MSLLEDFDGNQPEVNDDPMLEGIVDMGVSASDLDEQPMFKLEKVEYKPNGLKYMVVSSNILVMALSNAHIIRLNLENASDLEDIEISRRPDDQIHKLFLDPSGQHLIISMNNEENYYIHQKERRKPKLIPKLKGVVIDSVAWETHLSDVETPNAVTILIGTSKGRIMEAIIDTSTEKRITVPFGQEPVPKILYNTNERNPIVGLRVEKFPPTQSDPLKFFIMATTASRIYQFIGGPTFEALFSTYEGNSTFHELPGDLTHSELVFFSKYQTGLPKAFAWLTFPGIYHGDLVFGSQNPLDKVSTDTDLLAYLKKDAKGFPLPPLSLTMTEFHFMLLYEDRLQAICKLNKQVAFEYELNPRLVKMRGIAHDHTKGTIWVYGDNVIFEVIVTNEDRDVWKLYLEKGQFETALEYCKEPNLREKQDRILTARADHYFTQHQYELAAQFYGRTQRLFEEVTLRFIGINERDALKTYLVNKLKHTPSKDATQRTIICTWLTEIYINKLNTLKDNKQFTQYSDIQEEFHQFLASYKEHLNQMTTFNILSSHGAMEELLHFAILIEDYERVIAHYIQHHDYKRALQMLDKLGKSHEDVFYKFSPVLIHNAPAETVNAWIKASFLNPRKLIPALMRYDPKANASGETQNQAIRYLQHCVRTLKSVDPAIHNYLISLFAKHPDPSLLQSFLTSADPRFDQKYALRLCTKENKLQACVLIYSAMGLYEEAVDLALKVDIELAKINADKPEDDDALRKKLWLRIARHVVQEKKDIKEAMAFLTHCDLLKIEDILPFFPDFVLIDDFKEEICKSLDEYNRHIEDLKAEMDDATHSADLIRLDIKDLRNKYGYVVANQKCDLCSYPVLTKQFYLFPCQHVFHAECLIGEVMQHLNKTQKIRVRELQSKLLESGIAKSNQAASASSQPAEGADISVSAPNSIKAELDECVASECLFCGEIMIRSVDTPFISPDETDVKSWEV